MVAMTTVGSILRLKPITAHGARGGSGGRSERLAHAFWAAVVGLISAAAMLLIPLDWMIWTVQSRLGDQQPSGDIIYVQAESTLVDTTAHSSRAELARGLDVLRERGASRVFIDVLFPALDDQSESETNAKVATSLDRWGDRAVFVNRLDVTPGSVPVEYTSAASFARDRATVWSGFAVGWPGFSWRLPYGYETSAGLAEAFPVALAGLSRPTTQEYEVNYAIRSRSIPSLTLSALTDPKRQAALPDLAGKTIVVGIPRDPSRPEFRVPGQVSAPPSFVAIHAAETLKRGPPRFIPGYLVACIAAAVVALGALCRRRSAHWLLYGLAIVGPAYAMLVAPGLGLRIELSYVLPVLATYGMFRWRANWKRRVAEVDPDTGLPTLRALSAELEPGGHVVVAKIHRYETILKSLESGNRASYIVKLVERIRVGDPGLTVHVDGHYLAWRVDHSEEGKLREHLEGLRAIFAAPVTVNRQRIDVGITFGAAPVPLDRPERALAAALAAVEETSEALEPVKLADPASDADSLWDLSLRARIDSAMEAGEVFCVYQPKIDLAADRIVGVEALVRWEDPERGFIPPIHFVMQCEQAGRMEYLTRYVLQSACAAGKLLHFRGNRISMSVNISATLLTDMRIVGIVRNVLQATSFDPEFLVLEITETARIRDLSQAAGVLRALKGLGTQISMDDFGVGSANFETLQALPFDEIKIDRQFVSLATTSVKARAIAASIVGLGASARIAVVAEGAETDSDLQMLREIGCLQVQGYAIARPMSLTKLLDFIGNVASPGEAATI